LLRTFQAESAVRLLSFTADGTLIAFSERGGIAFHPPAGGPPALLPISTDPNDWVQLAAVTPDATRLATVNYSGTIRLWCRR
jgi:WD40 repeat protein